ncbi:MAG: hypothetical protein DHS20C16_08180 [Phycisphaerae bacterium]|nr:MAG: hypothetical protein DHS20C16_08180 [Phycisphaerae bacterium]
MPRIQSQRRSTASLSTLLAMSLVTSGPCMFALTGPESPVSVDETGIDVAPEDVPTSVSTCENQFIADGNRWHRTTCDEFREGEIHVQSDLQVSSDGDIEFHVTASQYERTRVTAVAVISSVNGEIWRDRLRFHTDDDEAESDTERDSIDPALLTSDIELHVFVQVGLGISRAGTDPIFSITNPATSHVIVLPGILGDRRGSRDVIDLIEEEAPVQGGATAQIWDWTEWWKSTIAKYEDDLRRDRISRLQARINIDNAQWDIAEEFATGLVKWRERFDPNEEVDIYLMGISGGTNIAALACEVRAADGSPILPEDFFTKTIFLSGALSSNRSLFDVDRASREIYNYYSYHDEILTVSKFWAILFGIPINLDVHVRWPAVGRFGYPRSNCNRDFDFVTAQLGWVHHEYDFREDREQPDWGNNGKHSKCLEEDYFRQFILPLFDGLPFDSPESQVPKLDPENPTEGWSLDLHPIYLQDRLAASDRSCLE